MDQLVLTAHQHKLEAAHYSPDYDEQSGQDVHHAVRAGTFAVGALTALIALIGTVPTAYVLLNGNIWAGAAMFFADCAVMMGAVALMALG